MRDTTSSLLKMAALVGGAVLGTILARVVDKMLSEQIQARSAYDRSRYEQGLGPMRPGPERRETDVL